MAPHRTWLTLAATALLATAATALPARAAGGAAGTGSAAEAGPALTVDLSAPTHPISPYVYGMNFTEEALAKELRLPVRRWGGNATTRYNFRLDTTNRASDWFFENIAGENANPDALPDGSETDRFVDQDRRTGTDSVITLPLIGWAPKERAKACGFSVEKYGPQQSTDQWAPDCGNGVRPDGTLITGNDPHDTSVEIGSEYVTDWMAHLRGRYGDAAGGGVKFYNLDNEPDIWHSTHRDVHPAGASYDEMRDRTYEIAAAVKAADPKARTLGPVGWGWSSLTLSGSDQQRCAIEGCWSNPPDQAAHGGVPFGEWYLGQMRAYEASHGVRILDYYDNHWYPQAGVFGGDPADPGDAAKQALRLRQTRTLWDRTYTDESWIGQPVYLIPRMKDMVARNYPGTKVAITEYNFGALGSLNGALAQADVLGILGREGADLATLWDPPTSGQPGAYAFQMYLNYDGKGGRFGDTSVLSGSADQGRLAVYGAKRNADGALTLMVVNKTGSDLTSPITIDGGAPGGTAQVYRYSGADLAAIGREADLPLRTTAVKPGASAPRATASATFPANSITALVVADTVPPCAPSGLRAGATTAHSVALSWSPAKDNVAVKGYLVSRQSAGEPVKTTEVTAAKATISELSPGRRYTFWVQARDLAGNLGPKSAPLQVTTPRR
ncbi:endoglucanase [Sphaerisporangium melleum]|uniref:Endoglucanase n=1 Tax=Sphaerisporangium melleum TaxID=321316 RepID=A0A917R784_9ACTN|nr:glycoside hydrolase family 44 protein [Sphaerisporangium melleum]GGK92823.1 endoglucanase [Sphaerisporangium melleum]GII73478.1 endoglucanase [Sphaerisporangium melleum]